ncbi:hypothetical protein [Streptomyces sp. NPDC056948]|uniref:hypothetical protein n=1 Tax=Streptomyces sp. NPDC056948 TaxID=3345975 RepID=UPI0036401481
MTVPGPAPAPAQESAPPSSSPPVPPQVQPRTGAAARPTQVQRFGATGAVQYWTVPQGVLQVQVSCWGSGGGSTGAGASSAGGGGYTTGTVQAQPGERLAVIVGNNSGFGGGGSGDSRAQGGGMSGLYSMRLAEVLMIAGGGGGGGSAQNRGGPGGGPDGGTAGGQHPARGALGASGGAGGGTGATAGAAGGNTGSAGGGRAGGSLPIAGMGGGGGGTNTAGGGGGYAGGGGGHIADSANASGGGGGSGFAGGPGVSNGRTVAGSGNQAAGKNDPLYEAGTGDSGRTGQVVLQWRVAEVRLENVAGDRQQADTGQAFADRLSVRALADGQPMPQTGVTFTVVSGEASFNGAPSVNVSTDGAGHATAPVITAGRTPGPVRIDATSGNARTQFTLTVNSPLQFAVLPGGPPDVELQPGGTVGYPGVVVKNTGQAPVGEQTLTVSLPAGRGLQWGSSTLPDYQITVDGTPYPGTLSPDGQTLTCENIDLAIPPGGQAVIWAGVSAAADAAPGYTDLHFTVGGQAADSTPVRIGTTVLTPPFSLTPGGPPEVLLVPGGATGYPGVGLANTGDQPVPPQTVTVQLPPDTNLLWGQPEIPDLQLTVLDAQGSTTPYTGTLSPDGQSLTFTDVDPGIPAPGSGSLMWVGVSAADDAALVYTSLVFTVGDRTSASTPVIVVHAPQFVVEPGGPPDVTLTQAGTPGYPGVVVRNSGAFPLLTDVTVTADLPAGRGLSFVAQAGPDHLLTVRTPALGAVHHTGRLSDDQQQLTVDRARLSLPVHGEAVLWAAVSATDNAPPGPATLTFTVNDHTSPSTPVHVTPPTTH